MVVHAHWRMNGSVFQGLTTLLSLCIPHQCWLIHSSSSTPTAWAISPRSNTASFFEHGQLVQAIRKCHVQAFALVVRHVAPRTTQDQFLQLFLEPKALKQLPLTGALLFHIDPHGKDTQRSCSLFRSCNKAGGFDDGGAGSDANGHEAPGKTQYSLHIRAHNLGTSSEINGLQMLALVQNHGDGQGPYAIQRPQIRQVRSVRAEREEVGNVAVVGVELVGKVVILETIQGDAQLGQGSGQALVPEATQPYIAT
ncbi:MAG: hypothetical protein BYD32DRAFT_490337 [Podila humilis]|nr:MAG: hypothetical protein BYD32DRAFT_490337 [Podila humilis]